MMAQSTRLPEGGLLQTHAWARFQEAVGFPAVGIALPDGPVYGFVRTAPIVGCYLYVPRGVRNILAHQDALRTAAARRGCRWVRVEPLEDVQCMRNVRKAPRDIQPYCVMQMDLMPDEKALLAAMKGKTRYNIRLAQKKGVTVQVYRPGDNGADAALKAFTDLVAATGQRKGVRFHAAAYYKHMFHILGSSEDATCALYVARYKDVIIAANLVTTARGVATYLHGATADRHRNVMAPFALQWRAIRDAKRAGCAWYDFGGYFAQATDGKAGFTRFKRGFVPQGVPLCVPGTYDLPIDTAYYALYRALMRVRLTLRPAVM